MAALSAQNKRELELNGFTVVEAVISPMLAQQAIELTNHLIGSAQPIAAMNPDRYQPGPWPEGRPVLGDGPKLPACATGSYRHSICHPIHASLMAELIEPLIGINTDLLRCPTERLKLLQQMLVRTDASPPPHPGDGGTPPSGWVGARIIGFSHHSTDFCFARSHARTLDSNLLTTSLTNPCIPW